MSDRNRAIFNDGVLKPVMPIEAKNGDVFEFVRVENPPVNKTRRDPAEVLAEIAEKFKDVKLEGPDKHHDYYLYGWDRPK